MANWSPRTSGNGVHSRPGSGCVAYHLPGSWCSPVAESVTAGQSTQIMLSAASWMNSTDSSTASALSSRALKLSAYCAT